VDYQPPPAFGPPESRVGPLPPDEAVALLHHQHQAAFGYATPAAPAYAPLRAPRMPWGKVVTAATLATVLIAFGLVAMFRASGGGHHPDPRLSLPTVAGRYQLINALDGATVRRELGPTLGALGPVQDALNSAQMGVYGVGADGLAVIVFLGFNGADSASVRHLLTGTNPAGVVAQLMSGAAAGSTTSIAPGPFGGALSCAPAQQGGTPFTACAWADHATLALVLRIGRVSAADVGADTQVFRAAAEH
jgi:hypothetical protein